MTRWLRLILILVGILMVLTIAGGLLFAATKGHDVSVVPVTPPTVTTP